MTRDELLALMRAWGWTLTGSLSNGRADLLDAFKAWREEAWKW